MKPEWMIVVAQAQHSGDKLKEALQGWAGPIFLAIIGLKAIALLFEDGKMARAIQLGIVGIVIAGFIYQPEVFIGLGRWFVSLL